MNLKKTITYFFIATLFLIQGCSPTIKPLADTSESPFKNRIIGQWAMLIQTDGDLSSNKIYLQLNFRPDGIVEYKGDGILYSGEKAAIFTMVEIKKWSIKNNFLFEKQIKSFLPNIVGDQDLKIQVKNLYEYFKKEREGRNWKWEIVGINADSLTLQIRDDEHDTSLFTYYKIN